MGKSLHDGLNLLGLSGISKWTSGIGTREMSNDMPPFRPNDIASDAQWLPLCSPQDRLIYWRAKGVYDMAVAGATAARDKAENAFNGVRFQLWTKLDDRNDEPPDPKALAARPNASIGPKRAPSR